MHAIVEKLQDDCFVIRDNASRNGVFCYLGGRVDRVSETVLTTEMTIVVGGTELVTVSADGRALLRAHTVTEFQAEAYRVYGTLRAASDAIGKSHETIRRAAARVRRRLYERRRDE